MLYTPTIIILYCSDIESIHNTDHQKTVFVAYIFDL